MAKCGFKLNISEDVLRRMSREQRFQKAIETLESIPTRLDSPQCCYKVLDAYLLKLEDLIELEKTEYENNISSFGRSSSTICKRMYDFYLIGEITSQNGYFERHSDPLKSNSNRKNNGNGGNHNGH